MTSYTQPNLIKHDERKYLSQFESELFDSLQLDSTKCILQCELSSFVTRAMYWVPDLPIIKNLSSHVAY